MGQWDFNKNGVMWKSTNQPLKREVSSFHKHNNGSYGNDVYYKTSLGKVVGRIDGLSREEAIILKNK